ncbi:hypothetical protein DM02DRAFT_130143 [Periconia macrospinosa]|uniref:Uncharacterized protein n=1 Tax=Periconia macrospinosa TaxID=97972 RepID=A0A2V1DDR8_9PLEO|nr:hypothetical protein DM02DRAFT_130143 [Periconia macrospinosa]
MTTNQMPCNAPRESRTSFETVSTIADNNENYDVCHNRHSASIETSSRDQIATGLDHHKQPEKDSSIQFVAPLDKKKYSVLRQSWKTPIGIVGFYLLAISFAAAHLGLFTYLNGKIINSENESFPHSSTTNKRMPRLYRWSLSLPFERRYSLVSAYRILSTCGRI